MDNQEERETSEVRKFDRIIRTIFGIFMVFLYVGMGVLLFINFFNFPTNSLLWLSGRYLMGVILVIYGFWRGYRQWKGLDYTSRY
jgi:cytochrome c biogenesis protein CcdA